MKQSSFFDEFNKGQNIYYCYIKELQANQELMLFPIRNMAMHTCHHYLVLKHVIPGLETCYWYNGSMTTEFVPSQDWCKELLDTQKDWKQDSSLLGGGLSRLKSTAKSVGSVTQMESKLTSPWQSANLHIGGHLIWIGIGSNQVYLSKIRDAWMNTSLAFSQDIISQ